MEQPDISVSELGCKFELTIVGETKARASFEKFEGDILTVDAGSENLKFAGKALMSATFKVTFPDDGHPLGRALFNGIELFFHVGGKIKIKYY